MVTAGEGVRKQISVLVVDDSAVVRLALKDIIEADPRLILSGVAPDPVIAAERINANKPDVVLLDVEMPRMDGLSFLRKLMEQQPLPVVICSTLAESGSDTALKALELGAVEVLCKPKLGTRLFFEESRVLIADTLVAAAGARVRRHSERQIAPKLTADAILAPAAQSVLTTTEKVVVIGASTGGTEALRVVLEKLPVDAPGIVIVQHMPAGFTKSFAQRLNAICRVEVREAVDGESVLKGVALIAPGDRHILLKRSGARYFVEVRDGPLVTRHRPSVDVLFRSAARYAGKNAVGVIMTGMGDDGARGMLELSNSGAYTLAQDQESCVVYGMPCEAVRFGGVKESVTLELIAHRILQLTH